MAASKNSQTLRKSEELQRIYINEIHLDSFNVGKNRLQAANQQTKKPSWFDNFLFGFGVSLLAICLWSTLLILFGFVVVDSFVPLALMTSVGLMLTGISNNKIKPSSVYKYFSMRLG